MYFPFLTCEVKCGAAALDIADRQNAHSMTMAVRGIVELFRLVKREKELHREILAFSISHDQRNSKNLRPLSRWGESHAKTTKGTHQVFVDGKALPDLAALMSLLKGEDII